MPLYQFSLKFWLYLIWLSARKFYVNNYSYQASALAYVTIVSLIPLLSIMVYLSTFFIDLSGLLVDVNNYLYDSFLPGPIITIRAYIIKFTQQATELPIVSIAFSLISGVVLIMTIENALSKIWHKKATRKSFNLRIISWITLLFLPLIIALSIFASEYLATLMAFDFEKRVLSFIFSIITNTLIFSILYLTTSTIPMKISDGFGAGLTAAVLLELFKFIFVFYINYIANYTFIYGTMAVIPILFLWIYLVWCIFLYGALFIYTRHEVAI